MSNESFTGIDASTIAALVKKGVEQLACTLRPDYLSALKTAAAHEKSERGREVLEQLLANAEIASGGLPLCQDTGYVWVCLEVHDPSLCIRADIFSGVNDAVAEAAVHAGMRMSIVNDALVNRSNTNNNTPALCELVLRPSSRGTTASCGEAGNSHDERSSTHGAQGNSHGEQENPTAPATLHIMLKGGGSDNASALTMLPPGAGIEGALDFVVERVAEKGANACPPLLIGVGVGGSFDKVAGLAKHALLRTIGSTHPNEDLAALESELLMRINALGIGPGGLGGSTTALAVHIESAPCHIAALPVAVNIGCNALRSVSIPLS